MSARDVIRDLRELADRTSTASGAQRVAWGPIWREAREWFGDRIAALGLAVQTDAAGNNWVTLPGASTKTVIIGGHLDSVPNGGKFDGALGVLAALEVVRTLDDLDIKTKHPIEIAMWTNEEGARFAPPMVASGVFAGVHALDWSLKRTDSAGKVFGSELERIGYAGPAAVGGRPVHAFFELHIEQGPILEEEGIAIGVVIAANGQKWYEITLTGFESHAGPTPMTRRKDALVGAARIIELVNRIGYGHDPSACATVGMLQVHPNSRNVIPGQVFLTVDLRHPDADRLDSMDVALRTGAEEIACAAQLTCELKQILEFPPTPFDASCVEAVRGAAKRLGYTTRDITSGAGHDAVHMARVCPTAMIFTPCVGGISHNETEDINPEWAIAGAGVLIQAALEKAEILPATR
jgi:N-carbamoyl-L-amino-acid hydrolase